MPVQSQCPYKVMSWFTLNPDLLVTTCDLRLLLMLSWTPLLTLATKCVSRVQMRAKKRKQKSHWKWEKEVRNWTLLDKLKNWSSLSSSPLPKKQKITIKYFSQVDPGSWSKHQIIVAVVWGRKDGRKEAGELNLQYCNLVYVNTSHFIPGGDNSLV